MTKMRRHSMPFILAAVLAVVLQSVTNTNACQELFAILGGAKTLNFTTVEKVDEKLLTEIRSAGSFEIMAFSNTLLADRRVTDALALSKTRLVLSSANPAEVRSVFTRKINSMSVIAVLPTTDDGIQNVFPAAPLKPTARYMAKVKKTLSELRSFEKTDKEKGGLASVIIFESKPNVGTMADQLLESIRKTEAKEFVTVICHNENVVIPLPDGSKLKLSHLHEALGERAAAVFTCNSLQSVQNGGRAVLTTRELQFDEVSNALVAIAKTQFYGGCHDFGELLRNINGELDKQTGPANTPVKLGAIASFSGLAIFSCLHLTEPVCNCGDKCKCDGDKNRCMDKACRKCMTSTKTNEPAGKRD